MMNQTTHRITASVALLLCASGATLADPPPGYYDSVNATNSTTLRTTLHAVIDDHQRFQPDTGCVFDEACGQVPVQVIVDMDSKTPGIQSSVAVTPCTTLVLGVAVYIIDPLEARSFWWIGYAGGIDRGIAFGHMPSDTNVGSVTDMAATIGTPANPGNYSWVAQAPALDPAFKGPELQYIEGGSPTPAVIPSEPSGPIFTVDLTVDGVHPGDQFNFYLFDFISVWPGTGGQGGAFSTQGAAVTLDTGGDAVPDGTDSIYGVDADTAVPVPPASFFVDYIDGPPNSGPAVIEVVPAIGDLDSDGTVGAFDLAIVLGSWGPCEGCPADFNGDAVVNAADLAQLLGAWGMCP